MRFAPKDDLEYSRQRLDIILNRRRIRFNPYLVSDKQLLEYAWQGQWGEPVDLTQMVIMTFTRLREVSDCREFDGIFMRVGKSDNEIFLSRSLMKSRLTAHDTLQGIHHIYGKSPIRNDNDIKRLVGKTVFVSRTIPCYRMSYNYGAVYRMHKLCGRLEKDAAVIRDAMCEAKIEMLGRLLEYPESPWHLDCRKGLFDYVTPIRALMARIQLYPQTPIPS